MEPEVSGNRLTEQSFTMEKQSSVDGGLWGTLIMTAAERAELITADGTVIAVRDGDYPFEVFLSYSATGESSACVANRQQKHTSATTHIFRDDGFTDFLREDGTAPAEGYYAWTSTIPGSTPPQRFVKYWDGFAFLPGIVDTGLS